MRFVVAHELTHWYSVMNDSAWDRLPYSLLEGVADSVGLRLAPEMETKQRGFWGQILEHTTEAEFERLVFTSYKEHLELSEQDGEKMRAVAFSVVDEIGIERLRELCERAQRESLLKVPPQWLADLVKQPRKLAR